MRTQVKVCVCGLGLLLPRLDSGPVCDDSAAEGSRRKCGAIYKRILPFIMEHMDIRIVSVSS